MASIDSRLAALAEAIERKRMEQECPTDDLSRSLYEMGRELAALDDKGKAELAEMLNLSMEDLARFIADYSEV